MQFCVYTCAAISVSGTTPGQQNRTEQIENGMQIGNQSYPNIVQYYIPIIVDEDFRGESMHSKFIKSCIPEAHLNTCSI